MDRLTKEERSKLMGKIKGRDTKIEKALYDDLIKMGFKYQVGDVKGRPDYAHGETKIAIFIDGCLWHLCPLHCKIPKTNMEFWIEKFVKNSNRDILINAELMAAGWKVIRIWGHTVKKEPDRMLEVIGTIIKARMLIINSTGKPTGGIDYL